MKNKGMEGDDKYVKKKAKLKRPKMVQRSEASSNISEFDLTEVGKEKVKLNNLLKTLKKTAGHVSIKKQLQKAALKKTLAVPLSKPQAEKIKRVVAYDKVSHEVEKWDSVVQSNRAAEQIIYPLKEPEFQLEGTAEIVKRFQTKTPLEEEVSKLLNNSENVLDQEKVFTPAEEKALQAMSLEEAKMRIAELRKMRALLSYKEAKAKRQNKIKSKKYHRILKKEKMKQMLKEFEQLQKTDPEAAKEKLMEADKIRILERMTLKHKSTGKWAHQQKLRAKYNPESRIALKEQLDLSRKLTEKALPKLDEKEERKKDENLNEKNDPDDNLLNLYKDSMQDNNGDADDLGENLSSWKNMILPSRTLKKKTKEVSAKEVTCDDAEEEEELVEETLTRKRTIEDFDSIETLPVPISNQEIELPKMSNAKKVAGKDNVNSVDVADINNEAKCLNSLIPDDVTFGDEDIDDADGEAVNIAQAFADEDLIAEFREEKKAVVNKEKIEGIDLFLPGWGSWGGCGIKPPRKKKQRFFIKPVEIPPRKDDTLGNVIINEDKDKKAAAHQVSDVPFPYKSVHQFQSSIRQPMGHTWNPETSYHSFIAPKVITKMGKIIDPIDANDVVLQKSTVNDNVVKNKKRPFRKKGQKSIKKKKM